MLQLAAPVIAFAESTTATFPQVQVKLEVDRGKIAPGESFKAAITFDLHPEWHIYWKNHGDYGLKPDFSFASPVALTETFWPVPNRIVIPPYTNFGYEGETRFIFELSLAENLAAGSKYEVIADLSWLICKEDCIPQEAKLAVPVQIAEGPTTPERSFETDLPRTPELAGELAEAGDNLQLLVRIPEERIPADTVPFFIPEPTDIITPGASQSYRIENGTLALNITPATSFSTVPSTTSGVLLWEDKGGHVVAADKLEVRSAGTIPALEPVATETFTAEENSLLAIILFSFLGGLILNVMPCVFPVISIKVLGLIRMTGDDKKHRRLHIASYTAGIVISLQLLAAALLFLRFSGAQIGWGFQLQSPAMVGFLFLLFTTLAFHFLGVLSFHSSLPSWLSRFFNSERNSVQGSFFDGLLAVLVASPCTAPFMGAALGYALVAPAYEALLIFLFLGLGLAFPFVLLGFFPSLISLLPKPGMWMETVQQLCAFPLLATALWLLMVLDRQVGSIGIFYSLTAALILLFVLWLLSTIGHRRFFRITGVALVAVTASAYVYFLDFLPPQSESATNSGTLKWEPFSEDSLSRLKSENRVVYVDFTAAWCLTCQVNKQLVFSSSRVVNYIKENNIALLKADWTTRSPLITRALEKRNRGSVPVVIVAGPGIEGEEVLPVVLTPAIVLEALERAASSG